MPSGIKLLRRDEFEYPSRGPGIRNAFCSFDDLSRGSGFARQQVPLLNRTNPEGTCREY